MNIKKKENFLLYHNMFQMIEELENEDVGEVIKAIFEYSINGNIAEFPKASCKSMLFKTIKNSIDINNTKYIERCENNRNNALKRWKKIFYNNQDFSNESFNRYCIEKNIEEDFEEILMKEKEYVDNEEYEKLKEDFNCKLISNETLIKNFS